MILKDLLSLTDFTDRETPVGSHRGRLPGVVWLHFGSRGTHAWSGGPIWANEEKKQLFAGDLPLTEPPEAVHRLISPVACHDRETETILGHNPIIQNNLIRVNGAVNPM
jgi:hypothetical protein